MIFKYMHKAFTESHTYITYIWSHMASHPYSHPFSPYPTPILPLESWVIALSYIHVITALPTKYSLPSLLSARNLSKFGRARCSSSCFIDSACRLKRWWINYCAKLRNFFILHCVSQNNYLNFMLKFYQVQLVRPMSKILTL